MRLVTRFTTSTALTGLLWFGGYGTWLVLREHRDLRAAVEREAVFVATGLRIGVENALRDQQISDVREVTLRLDGLDAEVDVYVVDARGALVVAPVGFRDDAPPPRARDYLGRSQPGREHEVFWYPERLPSHVIVASPLEGDDGASLGELVVVRSLHAMNDDLLETSGSVAVTVGSFVLLGTALGLVIGHRRLARPLQRLTRAMRQVRAGDAEIVSGEALDDELAELSREFNLMVEDLAVARAAAATEAEARREALRTLQSADRLVTVGQLSAAVAHEIGSPLQVLHGRARALMERPDDPERTRRAAEVLVRESERISRIVGQLLAVTRRRPVERTSVDLTAAARQVVALLEIEARRRRAVLEVVGAAVVVAADPDQIQQILLNLFTNALAAQPNRVVARVEARDGRAHVEVQDDGCGMDAEARERAFEPLFTTRSGAGGAGLGLVVVQSLVLEHGGRIRFESAPGQGTTFRIELPLGGVS